MALIVSTTTANKNPTIVPTTMTFRPAEVVKMSLMNLPTEAGAL
jgi:hypothetical protein